MIETINTSLFGMQKAEQKAATAADRIANVSTPPKQVQTPLGIEKDVVDLSTEAINLIEAENSFKTNATVLKTAKEMSEEILDVLAYD